MMCPFHSASVAAWVCGSSSTSTRARRRQSQTPARRRSTPRSRRRRRHRRRGEPPIQAPFSEARLLGRATSRVTGAYMVRSLARKTVRSRASLVLAASVLAIAATAPATAADKLYGLIVGIDDYLGTVNDLHGAVNDAEGIAASLQAVHADKIIKLVNGAATKSSIQ